MGVDLWQKSSSGTSGPVPGLAVHRMGARQMGEDQSQAEVQAALLFSHCLIMFYRALDEYRVEVIRGNIAHMLDEK